MNSTSAEMDFFGHLRELRKRLLYSIYAILMCAVLGYVYSSEIFSILLAPFRQSFKDAALIGTGPSEAFTLRLWVSFFSGVILSSPWIFFQLWKFIAPGLYENEKRLVTPFVISATALFLFGIWFSFVIIFPFALDFFQYQYQEIGITPTIRITEQLSMTIQAALGFGVVFEIPVLCVFLARLGILTDRTLIDGYRYAIILIFVIAALLTPPDVLTQILLAGPLLALYGASILLVRWNQPKLAETNVPPK